jgi:hypothetical protein
VKAERDNQNPYSSTDLDQQTVSNTQATTTASGRFWATLLIVLSGFRAFALVPQTNSVANPRGHEVAMAQLIAAAIAFVLACGAWCLRGSDSNHKSWGRLSLGLSGFIFVLSLLII